MLAFPNIKINLGLYITERRSDNLHNLLTCFYPVLWNDILEIVPSEKFEFVQTGLHIPGNPSDNLCVKAYELLNKEIGLPNARIHLHKIIPTGTGLGGGSSDAAFVLKTLNEAFDLKLNISSLESYAARLGSDCAFFIHNRPAIATGKGEILTDFAINLSGIKIIIVYPEIHISTADAFSEVTPKSFEGNFKKLLGNPSLWKDSLHNQFEESIFPRYPLLAEIKQNLYDAGAFYASMSGSGSAIFGLFEEEPTTKEFGFQTFQGTL